MASIATKTNYQFTEANLHNKNIVTELHRFPNHLNDIVLSYLDPDQLDMISKIPEWAARANHLALWNAFNVRNLFPELRIFGANSWQRLCDFSSQPFNISNLPKTLPTNPHFLVWLTRTIKKSPGQDKVTLLLNYYTPFHRIKSCVEIPKPGNTPLRINNLIDADSDGINRPTSRYRYTIISNNLIDNPAINDYKHCRELNSSFEKPTIYEAFTLQILSNLDTLDPNTKLRPLCTKSTFVICQEQMNSGRRIFVGQRANSSEISLCTDLHYAIEPSNQIVYGRFNILNANDILNDEEPD